MLAALVCISQKWPLWKRKHVLRVLRHCRGWAALDEDVALVWWKVCVANVWRNCTQMKFTCDHFLGLVVFLYTFVSCCDIVVVICGSEPWLLMTIIHPSCSNNDPLLIKDMTTCWLMGLEELSLFLQAVHVVRFDKFWAKNELSCPGMMIPGNLQQWPKKTSILWPEK